MTKWQSTSKPKIWVLRENPPCLNFLKLLFRKLKKKKSLKLQLHNKVNSFNRTVNMFSILQLFNWVINIWAYLLLCGGKPQNKTPVCRALCTKHCTFGVVTLWKHTSHILCAWHNASTTIAYTNRKSRIHQNMPNGQPSDSPIMLIRNILKLRMLGPETYCLYKQKWMFQDICKRRYLHILDTFMRYAMRKRIQPCDRSYCSCDLRSYLMFSYFLILLLKYNESQVSS